LILFFSRWSAKGLWREWREKLLTKTKKEKSGRKANRDVLKHDRESTLGLDGSGVRRSTKD